MWTLDDRSKKYISYDGPLPKNLYRYRSFSPATIDRLINFELLDEAIYLAALRDLNDPDEGRFRINFGTNYDDVLGFWRQAIASTEPNTTSAEVEERSKILAQEVAASGYKVPNHVINYTRGVLEQIVRVACFTTQPTNYSMWANYAKYIDATGNSTDHAGICIEYLCDEGYRNTTLHPVQYSDLVPEINVTNLSEEDLVRAIYSKSLEWQCESEWRITSVIAAKPPFPSNLAANSKIKLEGAVRSVIFGLKTHESVIQTFVSRLQPLKPNISFKRVIQDFSTFQRKVVDF